MNDFFAIVLGNSTAAVALAADGATLGGTQRTCVDCLDQFHELLSQARQGRDGSPVPLVVASVNPHALQELRGLAADVSPASPVYVAKVDFPIPMRTEVTEPARLGADRLLAALAAYRRTGGPCIVVDFGTAITVNAVRADGAFIGGAIFPGLSMMAGALGDGTAQLPRIPVPDAAPPVGRNTEEAIAAGLLHGTAGAAANLIIVASGVVGEDARVFLTGGDAARVANFLPPDCRAVSPDLVLEGLAIAYREWPRKGPQTLLAGGRKRP
jgi:type III pantothenate kinase